MKTLRAMAILLMFSSFLCITYGVHVSFFKVNVVFYAALLDVFIAFVATVVVIIATPYFVCFTRFEKSLIFSVCILLGYNLAISIPTVIDRSLSFYILEKLQQRGGGILQTQMPEIFISEYMQEAKLVEVRLTEQLESGTIILRNGCVKLTRKGDIIASFGQYFRKNWLPKKRLLMESYSDALVDPFRNGAHPAKEYACQ